MMIDGDGDGDGEMDVMRSESLLSPELMKNVTKETITARRRLSLV